MEYKKAEECQKWFKEEFMTPDNWTESYRHYPEIVVDNGDENWWIASFEHEDKDIIVTVEALSQKMGKEGVAWFEGSDTSQEKLHFTIKGGIETPITAELKHETIGKEDEDARHTENIHPLAERMIRLG